MFTQQLCGSARPLQPVRLDPRMENAQANKTKQQTQKHRHQANTDKRHVTTNSFYYYHLLLLIIAAILLLMISIMINNLNTKYDNIIDNDNNKHHTTTTTNNNNNNSNNSNKGPLQAVHLDPRMEDAPQLDRRRLIILSLT